MLDGELVALDKEGKLDFETLQLCSRSKKLVKFLFNLLHLIAFTIKTKYLKTAP